MRPSLTEYGRQLFSYWFCRGEKPRLYLERHEELLFDSSVGGLFAWLTFNVLQPLALQDLTGVYNAQELCYTAVIASVSGVFLTAVLRYFRNEMEPAVHLPTEPQETETESPTKPHDEEDSPERLKNNFSVEMILCHRCYDEKMKDVDTVSMEERSVQTGHLNQNDSFGVLSKPHCTEVTNQSASPNVVKSVEEQTEPFKRCKTTLVIEPKDIHSVISEQRIEGKELSCSEGTEATMEVTHEVSKCLDPTTDNVSVISVTSTKDDTMETPSNLPSETVMQSSLGSTSETAIDNLVDIKDLNNEFVTENPESAEPTDDNVDNQQVVDEPTTN